MSESIWTGSRIIKNQDVLELIKGVAYLEYIK